MWSNAPFTPFNSRPHKEVDCTIIRDVRDESVFQFTTSQGGRHLQDQVLHRKQITFNSRPHKEVDLMLVDFAHGKKLSIHDLTRRSTIDTRRSWRGTLSFNSRPHKEVDLILELSLSPDALSIHDLTRRSTLSLDLLALSSRSFNSRPHQEVDEQVKPGTR